MVWSKGDYLNKETETTQKTEILLLTLAVTLFRCFTKRVCVFSQCVLVLWGVGCDGTSCIIDPSLRFAHVAPPGAAVPGGCSGAPEYFKGLFSFV